MPVRKSAFSNVEQQFLLQCLMNGERLDHRQMLEQRNLHISFGIDHGCCTVDLGNTKIMAQVSCALDRPKESRPNEGRVNVHVELSTIAFPSFDPTKSGELGVTIQRMLERSLLFSCAIDLEELCVRVGEKVWALHLYVHVLSHDGNLVDCSYIAAVTALKHFRRPDVTVSGQEVIVHTVEEKNPLPLTLHHMPLCISFSFFNECDNIAVDPTYLEEKVMDGVMMISMNKHREMCGLQMSGGMKITKEQILHCTNVASSKVKDISAFITNAIDHDIDEKKAGKLSSKSVFQIKDNKAYTQRMQNTMDSKELHIEHLSVNESYSDESENDITENITKDKSNQWMIDLNDNTTVGSGEINQWFKSSNVTTEKTLENGCSNKKLSKTNVPVNETELQEDELSVMEILDS